MTGHLQTGRVFGGSTSAPYAKERAAGECDSTTRAYGMAGLTDSMSGGGPSMSPSVSFQPV